MTLKDLQNKFDNNIIEFKTVKEYNKKDELIVSYTCISGNKLQGYYIIKIIGNFVGYYGTKSSGYTIPYKNRPTL